MQTIESLHDWSWKVELDSNRFNGLATLNQMLCGRLCTYGKIIDINELYMTPDEMESMFTECRENKVFVKLAFEAYYLEPKEYRWSKPEWRQRTVCAWGRTAEDVIKFASRFLDEYTVLDETHTYNQLTYKVIKLPGV